MKIGFKIFSGFLFILFFVCLSFVYILTLSFNKIEEKVISDLFRSKQAVSENIKSFLDTRDKEALRMMYEPELGKIFNKEKKGHIFLLKTTEDIKSKIYGKEKVDKNIIIGFLDKEFNLIGANYGSLNWKDNAIFEEIKKNVLKQTVINDNGLSYFSIYNGHISTVSLYPYNFQKHGGYDGIIVLIAPIPFLEADRLKKITGVDIFMYSVETENAVSTLYKEIDEHTVFDRIKLNEIKNNRITKIKNKIFENQGISKIIINNKEYYIDKINVASYYNTDRSIANENIIGKIALLKDVNEIGVEKRKFIIQAVLFLVFQFSAAILISFFIASLIVIPIKELTKYIEKISKNEFNFEIPSYFMKRSDEIGYFFKSFNKMKVEINLNQKKISYYNKELEKSYKETKNYLYILELKNKEMEERLKERNFFKDILSKGITEISDLNNFLMFLLKKFNEYKPYKRAEIIYKNGIDDNYEKMVYIPESDKIIETSYNENLKYLMTNRLIIKDEYIEMPLKTRSGLIGNIKIESKELDRNIERIMEIIVSELQIILENTEFYNKLNKRVMELSFLNSILVSISSATDILQMKKMVKDAVAVLFNTVNSNFYIYENGYLYSFFEEEDELIKNKYFKIKNIDKYLDSKYEPIKADNDYHIPLVVKDVLVGAIEISNVDKFNSIEKNITKVFLVQLSIIMKNKLLELENKKKSFTIIKSLAEAIEAKDNYTRGHSERVMKYAVKIAEKMSLDTEYVEKIKYAGILHDVGKIGIPESILQKRGALTDEEYCIIKTHPEKGAKILRHMSGLNEINEMVMYHHERVDGFGYPKGLKELDIPLGAKILSIADTFDAMTSDRPYRKGLSLDIVKIEIEKNKGKQFDEHISNIVLDMIDNGELEIDKEGNLKF